MFGLNTESNRTVLERIYYSEGSAMRKTLCSMVAFTFVFYCFCLITLKVLMRTENVRYRMINWMIFFICLFITVDCGLFYLKWCRYTR
ncbi:UNVERIFIED_CONTAM: hypothetical protein RMT77_009417 [Armadillidium vulgare]